ncbi:hypothetical protein HPB47_020814, partial [Ixodes persulcatus]
GYSGILLCLALACVDAFWRRGEPPYPRHRTRSDMLLLMPGVEPRKAGDHYCTAFDLSYEEAYIVSLEPRLDGDKAHHMLLIGCENIFDRDHLSPGSWNCDRNNVCENPTVLYGWARNAPTTRLPPDVGFQVGRKTPVRYLLLQVHYSTRLPPGQNDSSGLKIQIDVRPQRFLAGIHVLYAKDQSIPPGQYSYAVNVNCRAHLEGSLFVFAYRVHTHQLGQAVTAYAYHASNGTWTTLARGNPHWPQAFYPMNQTVIVKPGDVLASRCTYNTVGRSKPTEIGPRAEQEMCNLYLMYYALSSGGRSSGQCENVELPNLVGQLPGDEGPPAPPTRPVSGSGRGRPAGSGNGLGHSVPVLVPDDQWLALVASSGWGRWWRSPWTWKGTSWSSTGGVVFGRPSRLTTTTCTSVSRKAASRSLPWSHWTAGNGHVLHSWGRNQFYMPHGLTVDGEGCVWVTDVAMHQVLRYPARGSRTPLLSLGEKFRPGSGTGSFCKPTSVAVTPAGDFYVADGYCNARIVHFDKMGKFLRQIGEEASFGSKAPPPGTFAIPHKVVLAVPQQLLCVADRENGRIQAFSLHDGSFRFQISLPEFMGQLYSVAYSDHAPGGLLFAVSGPMMISNPSRGFVFNLTSRELLGTFGPPKGSFTMPHDIACSKDVEEVYVGEISPNKLWRFVREVHRSTKKVLEAPPRQSNATAPPAVAPPVPEDNFGVSMVIMALLAIPILSFLVITIVVRLKRQDKLKSAGAKGWAGTGGGGKFDLGQLLQPHRGFDRLALDESGSEAGGPTSDSDVEEFNAATRKA